MKEKPTIIDFVNHYTSLYENDPYLYEKIGKEWQPTTFGQAKELAQRIAGGLMALGVEKTIDQTLFEGFSESEISAFTSYLDRILANQKGEEQ